MVRRQTANTGQLPLLIEEIDRVLSENRGKLISLPLSADDIGGALIAILSKGLYTNPLDCIREYVQNAVDAQAKAVTIKITGNSVLIYDEGTGMDYKDIWQARQFGLSPKSLSDFVGFRGIGIYSGFDLCKRLRITSTRQGNPDRHVLVFDFAGMKAELEIERKRQSGDPRIPLTSLLSKHTQIRRESKSASTDQHFTQVELQDISDVHIRQLSDRAEMNRYLLQNLPIDFDDHFEFKQIINQNLYANVRGYNAVKITLQYDGFPDEIVAKDAIFNLQSPQFEFIESGGQKVAYYWACLNKERGKISPIDGNGAQTDFAGFIYKMKGFTIGDRQRLRAKFARKPQLYPWYTGEIYVIDDNVIPNAARDDFETSPASRALDFAVGEKLRQLEDAVESSQAQGVAHERINGYNQEIRTIEGQVTRNLQVDDFKTYSRLDDMLRDIRRQRARAEPEQKAMADEIITLAERLQRQLKKEVESPTPQSKRRRRAAEEQSPVQPAISVVEPLPLQPLKTVPGIIADTGLDLDDQMRQVIKLIQESIEDVLVRGSSHYRNLLNDFEARLLSSVSED